MYTSYTEIFSLQNNKDASGDYLAVADPGFVPTPEQDSAYYAAGVVLCRAGILPSRRCKPRAYRFSIFRTHSGLAPNTLESLPVPR